MSSANRQSSPGVSAATSGLPSAVVDMLRELGEVGTAELLGIFVAEMKCVEDKLDQDATAINIGRLFFASHSMKGTAACYGAQRLSQAAAGLCLACKSAQSSDILAAIASVRAQCRECIEEYDAIRNRCLRRGRDAA